MFNLDIGKLAQMCSLCLNLSFEKCAYMIYYLVYGRLATKAYLRSLMNEFKSEQSKIKAIHSSKTSKNSKNNGDSHSKMANS